MRWLPVFSLIFAFFFAVACGQHSEARVTLSDPLDRVAQARIYIDGGKFTEAESQLLLAAESFRNAKPPRYFELALTSAMLGDVYRLQGQFKRAVPEYESADTVLVRLEETVRGKKKSLVLRHRGRIANDAGLALAGTGDHLGAVTKFHKSLSIKKLEFDAGDPVFAPTYSNLADSLIELKDYRQATVFLRKYIEIWVREHGDDDLELYTAYARLAAIAKAERQHTEVLAANDRAISILEADPEEWHDLTIEHLQEQREILLRFGFEAAAEKRLRRELELRQAYQPDDATALVAGYRELGDLIRKQGRPSEALPILHHALLLSRLSGQANAVDLVSQTRHLANAYLEDRQFDAAKAMAFELVSEAQAAARTENIDASEDFLAAASILYRTGNVNQAINLQARVLRQIQKESGPESSRLIEPLRSLAHSQRALRQYDNATATMRRALAIARSLPNFSESAMAQMLGQYGFLMTEAQSATFAEHVLDQRLEMTRNIFGTKHIEYALAMMEVSNLHGFRHEWRDAISKGELALAVAKLHPDEPGAQAHIMHLLGMTYWNSGSSHDPEPVLQQALKLMERGFSPDHPFVAEVADHLAVYRYSIGRKVRVEGLTKKALRIRKATFGENHEQYALSLSNLGQIYQRKGKEVEAAELFLEAITIYGESTGLRWLDAAKPMSALAAIYQENGYLLEALPLWEQAVDTYQVNLGSQNKEYRLAQKELGQIYFHLGYLVEARPVLASYLAYVRETAGAESEEAMEIAALIAVIDDQTSQKL